MNGVYIQDNMKKLTFYVNRASRRKGLVFHPEVETRTIQVFPPDNMYEIVLK